jgi:LysR family transcriptional regulator of gallate degradation
MIPRNLRHFRVFLAVAQLRSLTLASEQCRVSQPSVTQTLGKLEHDVGGTLFDRTRQGFFLTDRGTVFEARIGRAMGRLDVALHAVSHRLTITATVAQLQALIAMVEAQNFTLAARSLGHAQSTVHRAIRQIEKEAARPLFERKSFGMMATRPCRALAQAARLAFSEFEQAEAEVAEFDGREVGRIVVGSLPLSRSVILPDALARFRSIRPKQLVTVIDGPYGDLLRGVRRGDIDFMIGALREPLPIEDVTQEVLFEDSLSVLVRPEHPLAAQKNIALKDLALHAWAVPRSGAPSRLQFDAVFAGSGISIPESLLECGSILLMRELLARTNMIGCISRQQAEAEVRNGLLVKLKVDISWAERPIGLTYRKDWLPTASQSFLLDSIRTAAFSIPLNRPQFAGGSKVSMDGAYGKK